MGILVSIYIKLIQHNSSKIKFKRNLFHSLNSKTINLHNLSRMDNNNKIDKTLDKVNTIKSTITLIKITFSRVKSKMLDNYVTIFKNMETVEEEIHVIFLINNSRTI